MATKTKIFTASVFKENKLFVAQCLEVDVASQGKTSQTALVNLKEALELYFEDPTAQEAPKLLQVKVKLDIA